MNLLDIVYPRRCALCDKVIAGREYPVCFACRKKITLIEGTRCMQCSKPLKNDEDELCLDCKKHKNAYECGFAPFAYEGAVQESLMRFKYQGRQEYSAFYAKIMAATARDKIEKYWKPEILIPIPVHSGKLIKRGYNQAEVLAQALGKELCLDVDAGLVKRVRRTKAQKGLDNRERRQNLKEAFALNGKAVYRSALLVDDIYTTGSTVNAVSALLRKSGVARIYFITVSVGRGL